MRISSLCLVLLACGGRTLDDDLAAGGAGAGGFTGAGGAASTSAGGAWLGPPSIAEVTRSCVNYCHRYYDLCTTNSGDRGSCIMNCTAVANSDAKCGRTFVDTLQCALIALPSASTCVTMPSVIAMSCQKSLVEMQQCGLSLPGAEACSSIVSESANNVCSHTTTCGTTSYETKCQNDSAGSTCTCVARGAGTSEFSMSGDVPSCQLDGRLACGPMIY
ncbi:MAG: hypothetical protein QM756_45345 [Polyangiaceae bacterium]